MATTAVCIGGSKDGVKMTLLYGRELRVALPAAIPIEPGVDIVSYTGGIKFETYRLATVRHMAVQRHFWVHESLSDADACPAAVRLIKSKGGD